MDRDTPASPVELLRALYGAIARESPAGYFVVLLLYLGLAVVYTFPLAFKLSTHYADSHASIDIASDASAQIWYSWWVQKAILSLEDSLLYCGWVFYPHGMEMTLQPAMFLHGAMTVPLFWLDTITATNVVILLSFVLSGLSAFRLGMYLLCRPGPALFCGLVFAFIPFKLQHLEGHYQLMATETLPLVALSLVRLFDQPSRRHLVWAGLWLGVTVYTDYYYFAYALLLYGFISIYRTILSSRRGQTFRHVVLSGLLAFVVASPLLVPALISASQSDYSIATGHDKHKADLLSFVVPSQRQWIARPMQPLLNRLDMDAIDGMEHSVYVGWSLLLMCVATCKRVWGADRNARLFVLISGAFGILALGPHLSINGFETFGSSQWRLPLPAAVLAELPFLEGARAPSRIFIIAALGLAVWGGYGLRVLLEARPGRSLRAIVPIGMVAATAVEYVTPVAMAARHNPPWVEMIRVDPEPGIVAHVPMRPEKFPFWQTQFERKMMLVNLGRTDPEVALYYWRDDALRTLAFPWYVARKPDPGVAGFLVDLLRIRYVVVDRSYARARDHDRIHTVESLLHSAYGMVRVHADATSALFRLPRSFRKFRSLKMTADDPASDLILLYGWSNRRQFERTRAAWMTHQNPVLALPPMDGDTGYDLRLDLVVPGSSAINVTLSLGAHDLGTHRLAPGANRLGIAVDRGILHDDATNLLSFGTNRTVGLPHQAGLIEHPAPSGFPIEIVSQGVFTRSRPRSWITVGEQRVEADQLGLIIAHIDSTGMIASRFIPHLTDESTVESLKSLIDSALPSTTVVIAANGSSEIGGGQIHQALTGLGISGEVRFNWLNSLIVVGARDGRPPIVDTGAASAEVVLGRVAASREAAVGLVGLQLVQQSRF